MILIYISKSITSEYLESVNNGRFLKQNNRWRFLQHNHATVANFADKGLP